MYDHDRSRRTLRIPVVDELSASQTCMCDVLYHVGFTTTDENVQRQQRLRLPTQTSEATDVCQALLSK